MSPREVDRLTDEEFTAFVRYEKEYKRRQQREARRRR